MKKKRTVNILSRELREILSYFKAILTKEDLEFLKTCFPKTWTDFSMESSWNEKNARDMLDVNARITEILDAKKREARLHFYTDGLDIDDALEVARILEIKIPPKTKKRKIIRMILKEIRKKCKRCQGTGKVGEAESTEGRVPIFCLECLGTGIKRR